MQVGPSRGQESDVDSQHWPNMRIESSVYQLVMRWTRNAIYCLLILSVAPWILYRIFRGRYRSGWRQKFWGLSKSDLKNLETTTQKDQTTVWLHGVSVGEVQLLCDLISRLRDAIPNAQFVLSTTTESGMQVAQQRSIDADLFYFPLDFSWAVSRTLRTLSPSLLILGELELWPNLIDLANRADVPLAVINGRLSENSYRGYRRLERLTRPMFQKLTLVAAQTPTYAQRFAECGVPATRVALTGNLKFDNVSFSANHENVGRLRSIAGITNNDKILMVGSTQAPEELAAAKAFFRLRPECEQLRLVVIPRHPDRFEEVYRQLQDAVPGDCRLTRRTSFNQLSQDEDAEASTASAKWDVLLVDTVGELRWWWGLADIAVVGGSFGKRGGQNMLEPAAYGKNVAFGPNTSNFKDIAELLLENEAASRIQTLDDLHLWLHQELSNPQQGKQRGQNAVSTISDQQGASETTIGLVVKLLAQSSADQESQLNTSDAIPTTPRRISA